MGPSRTRPLSGNLKAARAPNLFPGDAGACFCHGIKTCRTGPCAARSRKQFDSLGAIESDSVWNPQPHMSATNCRSACAPSRNVAIQSVIADLSARARGGAFPRAVQPNVLAEAIDIVGAGFGYTQFAGFQARAWDAILLSLFGGEGSPLATMLTAGVSSGKTFAFLLPAVTLLVYRTLTGEGGVNRVLVIYPRTSLVGDQFHNLRRMIERVNDEMDRRQLGRRLTPIPALDAGNLLGSSLQVEGSLADVLPEVSQRRIEVILTTPESLKYRLVDPPAARTYLAHVEIVVFDEVHLMEGLSGCQQIYFVRRIRELMREIRRNLDFQPAWVGASATVAQPVDHACRVFSIPQLQRARVQHVRPDPDEMERFATFHHAFVHTRVGKPAISAVTNGLACLAHTRNDGTAHTHYVDPSATPLIPRPSEQMPKTIAFVDSLSTIGRLDFTTRDNERCWNADDESPIPGSQLSGRRRFATNRARRRGSAAVEVVPDSRSQLPPPLAATFRADRHRGHRSPECRYRAGPAESCPTRAQTTCRTGR